MNATRMPLADVWGSQVVEGSYAGHAGLVIEPRPRSLRDLLAATTRWESRCFLVQGDKRLTFGQVLRAVEPARAVLAEHGLRAGDRMLLSAYNSPTWVLALLAAWRVGAVPVLGNRWWSGAELEHARTLSRPALEVTDRPSGAGLGLYELDRAFDAPQRADLADVVAAFPAEDEDDPAVVIFTSGSSGPPKGVVLSHRSVIANQHNVLSRTRRLPGDLDGTEPASVTLVCTPLFHVGGVSNLLTNLVVGGRIVLTEGRFDATEVMRLVETEGVQSFGGVPTMAVRVLEHPDVEGYDLSSLRSWPLGGAPLPAHLLDRMAQRLPQLRRRGLGNTWGMTESGGFLTGAGNRDLAERPGTVGRPYPVVELRIFGPDGSGVGEILVRSPTVMLGYLGDEEQPVDADGWLHTGDLGHVDDDGYLYLDGRSKDIVIRGGENVACDHVELALTEHPDVVEASVLGVPHPDLGEELVAVVVHREGADICGERLREFLTGRLAYFAIPTRWVVRTEPLPTLAGEKADKNALRELFTSGRGEA